MASPSITSLASPLLKDFDAEFNSSVSVTKIYLSVRFASGGVDIEIISMSSISTD